MSAATPPVRGTQTLVDQMGWVFRRPVLIALELLWRWIFALPILALCLRAWRAILTAVPPESAGVHNLDTQNPWVAATQIGGIVEHYVQPVQATLHWLLPLAAVTWIVASGFGRALVLCRMERGIRYRPFGLMALQAAWLAVFAAVMAVTFRALHWAVVAHMGHPGEPDLVGLAMWVIFLSLGFFSLWAVVSFPVAVAPILLVTENRSALSAFSASFRLGRVFTGKLMEINLVMGIVKLALLVLTMVFSAAPLPFSDQLGPEAMRMVSLGALAFYIVASDYFQVVRLKAFLEFRRTLRG